MPFENQWSRIPLLGRWGISLLVTAVLVVALVAFVTHNGGAGEVAPSRAALAREAQQDTILIGQDQAPHTAHVSSAADVRAALVAGVRTEMRRRIGSGNVPGPLQWVRCGRSGGQGAESAYHCIAKAGEINYPFVAVASPRAHRVTFCKKDFPPVPSENIPVSRRCRL